MTTKFRPSIPNYCCKSQSDFLIEEIIEELDELIAEYEQKYEEYLKDGYHHLYYQFCGQAIGLSIMKINLLNKKKEVRERYERNN